MRRSKGAVKADTQSMATDQATEASPGDRERPTRLVAVHGAAALDEIVAAYQDRVARLTSRLLGWRVDVDDVVQDVFVAVLENLSGFRGESDVGTWIYRITVNACRRRRRWFLRWLPADVGEAGPMGHTRTASATLLAQEVGQRVRAAVRKLPQRYREVVVLRYLEGLSITEVARILGLERNAVEVRLTRARARLKPRLAGLLEE